MQIKYKLLSAHVCQDNVCFKTPFVLVKNMTDKVILGIPFLCLLYPFTTDNNGLTTHTCGQKVQFKFFTKQLLRDLKQLKDQSASKNINILHCKTLHLKYLQEEFKYLKIEGQLANKSLQVKI